MNSAAVFTSHIISSKCQCLSSLFDVSYDKIVPQTGQESVVLHRALVQLWSQNDRLLMNGA